MGEIPKDKPDELPDKTNAEIEKTEPEPVYKLESNVAEMAVFKTTQGDIVRIQNKTDGMEKELNDLLPPEYKFDFRVNSKIHCRCRPDIKKVELSDRDLSAKDWYDLLIILHEIAHAKIVNANPEESRKLSEMLSDPTQWFKNMSNPAYAKKYYQLHSISERDAWALALKMFKDLKTSIGIKDEDLALTPDNIRGFIHDSLNAYKKKAAATEEESTEVSADDLRKTISKLYTRKAKK
jgi:hypothetical protein